MLVNHVTDDGFTYMKRTRRRGSNPNWLKVLEKSGVIGVCTVQEIPWGNTTKPSNSGYGYDYFKIWITPSGHEWMQGKVPASPPIASGDKARIKLAVAKNERDFRNERIEY